MNKKRNIIILICIVLILILSPFIYKYCSKPKYKYKDLDSSWGMGTKVTKSVSNDKSYEWYVDQISTGRNAELNCGPSVIEMAAKWQDENSVLTVEDIVNKYIPDENMYIGVGTYELLTWLENYNVRCKVLPDINQDSLVDEIDKGNIVIVGLDFKYMESNPNNKERVGSIIHKIDSDSRILHGVIVKGYKIVDEQLYFETYDPASGNRTYDDGQLIGKNRYYKSDKFIEAANMYFPDVIIIEK